LRTPSVRRVVGVPERLERGYKEHDKNKGVLGTPRGQLEEASGALSQAETLPKFLGACHRRPWQGERRRELGLAREGAGRKGRAAGVGERQQRAGALIDLARSGGGRDRHVCTRPWHGMAGFPILQAQRDNVNTSATVIWTREWRGCMCNGPGRVCRN
jgi:hypothetical protein